MTTLNPKLISALERLADTPHLLVASDYDGVLAPIVTDPARAFPLPEAMAAISALATLPRTTVALVSGRTRADLSKLAQAPAGVLLIGSHGAELDDGFPAPLDESTRALHRRLRDALTEIIDGRSGSWLEQKPASLVVHTRTAGREDAAWVTAAVLTGPATWPGVHVTTGKEVVELAVTDVDKGSAIDTLRTRPLASAVLFLGDDVTDENAFARLRDSDVGVKIGPGETRAAFRVPDPPAAAQVLSLVAARRAGR